MWKQLLLSRWKIIKGCARIVVGLSWFTINLKQLRMKWEWPIHLAIGIVKFMNKFFRHGWYGKTKHSSNWIEVLKCLREELQSYKVFVLEVNNSIYGKQKFISYYCNWRQDGRKSPVQSNFLPFLVTTAFGDSARI